MGDALLALQPASSCGVSSLGSLTPYGSLGRNSSGSMPDKLSAGMATAGATPAAAAAAPPALGTRCSLKRASSGGAQEQGGSCGPPKSLPSAEGSKFLRLASCSSSGSFAGSASGQVTAAAVAGRVGAAPPPPLLPSERKAVRLSPQLLHACRQRAYQTQIMEVGLQPGL